MSNEDHRYLQVRTSFGIHRETINDFITSTILERCRWFAKGLESQDLESDRCESIEYNP